MATVVFIVPDLSWGPDERTVPAILSALDGVRSVNIDIQARQISVDFDDALVDADRMRQALQNEDYAVESVVTA
jgi:copper chaperone CopZ